MTATGLVLLLAAFPTQPATAAVTGLVRRAAERSGPVVVYLVLVGSDTARRVADTVLVDQRGLTFEPAVVVGQPGLAVEFLNSDPILHNVFGLPRPGPGWDLGTYPRPESRIRVFEEPGAHVILCHIHPEMLASVVIVPTPYFTAADQDGRFRIGDLPPGTYRLRVWQAQAVFPERTVVVKDGETVRVEVAPAPTTRRRE